MGSLRPDDFRVIVIVTLFQGEKRSGIPKCRGAKSKIDDPSALANLKWNAFNFALLSYLTIGNKLKKYRAEIKGFVK